MIELWCEHGFSLVEIVFRLVRNFVFWPDFIFLIIISIYVFLLRGGEVGWGV